MTPNERERKRERVNINLLEFIFYELKSVFERRENFTLVFELVIAFGWQFNGRRRQTFSSSRCVPLDDLSLPLLPSNTREKNYWTTKRFQCHFEKGSMNCVQCQLEADVHFNSNGNFKLGTRKSETKTILLPFTPLVTIFSLQLCTGLRQDN